MVLYDLYFVMYYIIVHSNQEFNKKELTKYIITL